MSASLRLLRVLRHRDFRLLWLAQGASLLGDRIVTVALALFVIDVGASATSLGLVLAAYTLPLIAFILVGGVFADRLARHRVMVCTDLVRFALHALLAILIFTDGVQIWHVCAIGVLFGSAEAFFTPAATGLLPQTVPEDEIQEAKAVLGMFANVAEFAGPALATALVLGFSAAAAFAIDAATFLLSAALLIRLRPRERGLRDAPAHGEERRPGIWPDLVEGFAEVRARAWIWVTLSAFCVALFVVLAPWFVVGPIVAREQYGSLAVFGIVSAVLGAGTIAGSLAAIRWRPRHPMRQAMTCILLWPIGIALFGAGVTLVAVLPVFALAGAGIALFDVWWETAIADRVPADKLSRVSSYDWLVSLALLPLGYVLAGPLAAAIGASELLLAGGALGFVALALGLVPRETRMLERLPRERERLPRAGAKEASRNKMWRSGCRIVDARRRARAQAGASPSSTASGVWRRETVRRARSLFLDAD